MMNRGLVNEYFACISIPRTNTTNDTVAVIVGWTISWQSLIVATACVPSFPIPHLSEKQHNVEKATPI